MYSEGAQARLQGREAKRGFAISLTLNTKENTFAVGYENFCYTKIQVVLPREGNYNVFSGVFIN